MENRLLMNWQLLPLLFMLISIKPATVCAQTSFFTFQYNGPSNVAVGPDCVGVLYGSLTDPTVTSTVGASITQSYFDTLTSGFGILAPFVSTNTAIVHWFVADNVGHTADYIIPIDFIDTMAPQFNLSGISPFVQANSILEVTPHPNIPVSDNCSTGPNIVVTYSQTTAPALCEGGTFMRTWVARDEAGNTAAFTQTVVIYKDTLSPVITVAPQNGASTCELLPGAFNAWVSAQMAAFQATDPSGISGYSHNAPTQLPGGCPGAITVTFKAKDQCNFEKTVNAVFNTYDNAAPVKDAEPMDSIFYCNANYTPAQALGKWLHERGGARAHDACSPDSTLSYWMQVNGTNMDSIGVTTELLNSFTGYCNTVMVGSMIMNHVIGQVNVDFFVKDQCDHVTHLGKGAFGVLDTSGPVIQYPAAITQESCGGGDDQQKLVDWINAHGNSVLSDACAGVSWSNFSWVTSTGVTGNGDFSAGPYPQVISGNCQWYVDVLFKAADFCNNPSQQQLRFQIQDNSAPVFEIFAAEDTLFCPGQLPVNPVISATDGCDASVVVGFTWTTIDTICAGTYRHHGYFTATDDCLNTATAPKSYIVRDTLAPNFTAFPADLTLYCGDPVPSGAVQAEDLCGAMAGISMVETSTKGTDPAQCNFYNYVISRTYTAMDQCGNTKNRTQYITVADGVGPVFGGFVDTTITCNIALNLPTPVPSDFCGGPVSVAQKVNEIVIAGSCPDTYTYKWTWQSTDVCGNVGVFDQYVHVQDTIKPILTGIPASTNVNCGAVPAPPALGVAIVGTDNCDNTVTITFNEIEIRDPDITDCGHYNYGIIRQWTATDNCGNAITYTQNIAVQDNFAPVVESAGTFSVPNTPGNCSAEVYLPGPLGLYDACTGTSQNYSVTQSADILNTSGLPNISTPVDEVVFVFATPNLPPLEPVVGNAILSITLQLADAEQPSEHFKVFGENNEYLGKTLPVSGQCGSGITQLVVPSTLLNAWLQNGEVILHLRSNGTGSDGINAICAGGKVIVSLDYSYFTPNVPLQLTYTLDNGAPAQWPDYTAKTLEVGTHQLTWYASDCNGNTASNSISIAVTDIEPPVMIAPDSITIYADPINCILNLNLPQPDGISDNCDFANTAVYNSVVKPVKFAFDPDLQQIPQDMSLAISGISQFPVGDGVLKITHLGDNDEVGEFFRVKDEGNQILGNTSIGAFGTACSQALVSSIAIPRAKLLSWFLDSTATFNLSANKDIINYTHFIANCGPILPDGTDGSSSLQVSLEFPTADVDFAIVNMAGDTLVEGQLSDGPINSDLMHGAYMVQYHMEDAHGNNTETAFPLAVRDTTAPHAICKNVTIYTNFSGQVSYTLSASEVNLGSYDNCDGSQLSLSVFPNQFDCSMVGANLPITLTATDAAGNSATCTSVVHVENQSFVPTYASNTCANDTLKLFANAPSNPSGSAYNYLWAGPGGFNASIANPVIPNIGTDDGGTYSVTVTGTTGCSAVGFLQVTIANVPTTPVVTPSSYALCDGDDILLSAPTYSGILVEYVWYSGTPQNPQYLGTTLMPDFFINNPPIGALKYFVKVIVDGCESSESEAVNVAVNARPVAVVNQPSVTICEGQPLVLGTTVFGANLQYDWTGPNGFVSNQQYPQVISNALPIHSGIYNLIITQNGCVSTPVQSSVLVTAKPTTPYILPFNPVCEGGSLQLVSSVNNVDNYLWVSPQFDTIITADYIFQLNDLSVADTGFWRLYIENDGCLSNISAPQKVIVGKYPTVTASTNAPVCQSDLLALHATSNDPLVSYQWTGPAGFNTYTQDPTLYGVTGIYTVVATTPFGCADTALLNVTIHANPVITSVSNNGQPCVTGNQDITLQAVIFPPDGQYLYHWSGPAGYSSSEKTPIIANVSEDDNGPYILYVVDGFGCTSFPQTTVVNVTDLPVTPLLNPLPTLCEGQNLTIPVQNVNQYTGTSVSFIWTTPMGVQTTASGQLDLSNVLPAYSGNYSVRVEVDGCLSDTSILVALVVNDKPDAPTITANNPVCQGQTIQFITAQVPGATYTWSGPGGFSASVFNPAILQADPGLHSGLYYCSYNINGCVSQISEPVEIEVKPLPTTPIALVPQSVCLDNPGASVLFNLSSAGLTPGASYTWFNSATGTAIGAPTFASNYQWSTLNGYNEGVYFFNAVANLDGCLSAPSNAVPLTFNEVPALTAFAGNDFYSCIGAVLQLSAAAPTIGSGSWSLLPGSNMITINDAAANNTVVSGGMIDQTYSLVWTLSNGACTQYSADTVQFTVIDYEHANIPKPVLDTCFATAVTLQAVKSQFIPGVWSQPVAQQLLNVVIESPNSEITNITGLEPGNTYYFFWTLQDQGCGISTDTIVVRSIGTISYAGEDKTLCDDDGCTILSASPLQIFETGLWTTNDPDVEIASPTNYLTTVCGLKPGNNSLFWVTNGGVCGAQSRDTVQLYFELNPVVFQDTVIVPFGKETAFNVLADDILPAQYVVTTLTEPIDGVLTSDNQGHYTYQPDLGFSGRDLMVYKVCNANCDDACGIATVTILVNSPSECVAPTVITPNGDNYNDFFFVPCLGTDEYPDNEVSIFNQWGDEVYYAKPYLNDWEGTYNGNPLPAGTYFYVIKYNGKAKTTSGFLVLQR